MKLKMYIIIGVILALFLGIIGFKFMIKVNTQKFMASMTLPPQAVSSIKAEKLEWQPHLEEVGSLRAINGTDLTPEVPGIVSEITFESGSDVEKGDVLLTLRSDDDLAKLRSLEAAERLASITFDRDDRQFKVRAISQATVDNDRATLDGARALVAQQKAFVEKKVVRAPFSGRLGIRQVDPGQYITPGNPVVTLQQLDPIYADFTVPEQALTQVNVGQKIMVHVTAFPDKEFEGTVTSINAKIDEATRNIGIRATVKNPDRKLLPGMFSSVVIDTGKPEKYITLPQTAITFNPYGNTVYVVSKDEHDQLIAKQSFVVTGLTRGDQIAVLSGISEGDEIVSSGQMKLRNGAPITINNEITPKNDHDPKPHDQ